MTALNIRNIEHASLKPPTRMEWSRNIQYIPPIIESFHEDRAGEDFLLEAMLALATTGVPGCFDNYCRPTEGSVEKISKHLRGLPEGWFVSTGTERSFFDLILADPTCSGMVIRDINPEVQRYNNCLILLLRIAKNQQDFIQLSRFSLKDLDVYGVPFAKKMQKRTATIHQRILADQTLPQPMREYYLANLGKLTETYFKNIYPDPWETIDNFDKVNYLDHEEAFLKLQSYARRGRIISTIGSINDLKFLETFGMWISLIDTSNIEAYELLDLENRWEAKIIRTSGWMYPSQYHASYWDPLSAQEKQEFDALFQDICSRKQINTEQILKTVILRNFLHISPTIPRGYCKQLLEELRKIYKN